jgi:hypothetical protein
MHVSQLEKKKKKKEKSKIPFKPVKKNLIVHIGQTTSMVALFSPTFFDSSKTWHNESF